MRQRAILHIEDDPSLANVVKLSFESFGFEGDMLYAGFIKDAFSLLKEREQKCLPIDLIISDMQLQDGQGLDLLQHIKACPTWHKTPVIILSGDCSPGSISDAYALGANCYLSKFPRKGKALENFRSIYQFWLETTLLPKSSFVGGMQEILSKAIRLRTRTSQFYINLSNEAATYDEQESFWLERALVEGNLSSLLSFFCGLIDGNEISIELSESFSEMQIGVESALERAEQTVRKLSQHEQHDIYCAVLGLVEAWDEELLAELFKVCFPMNPSISKSMKSRASMQLSELANYVNAKSDDKELIRRAGEIYQFSQRIADLLDEAKI